MIRPCFNKLSSAVRTVFDGMANPIPCVLTNEKTMISSSRPWNESEGQHRQVFEGIIVRCVQEPDNPIYFLDIELRHTLFRFRSFDVKPFEALSGRDIFRDVGMEFAVIRNLGHNLCDWTRLLTSGKTLGTLRARISKVERIWGSASSVP